MLFLLFICLTIWPSPVSPFNSCFLCFLPSPPDCSSGSNPVYCSSGLLLMFVLASMSISISILISVLVSLYISASMWMSISQLYSRLQLRCKSCLLPPSFLHFVSEIVKLKLKVKVVISTDSLQITAVQILFAAVKLRSQSFFPCFLHFVFEKVKMEL